MGLKRPHYASSRSQTMGKVTAHHDERLPGRPLRQRRRALADWTALHRDAYPASIGWEEDMTNQERLTDNAARYVLRTRGAPRKGGALWAGLAVCGRCGRQMHVEYKASHRYVCSALAKEYGASLCLHLDGPSVDVVVVGAFFAALQPAELDLLDEVLAALRADHERTAQHDADQIKRAAYEAHLAQRQYQAVDPDNRLVAAELERRWDVGLRALAEAREAAERFVSSGGAGPRPDAAGPVHRPGHPPASPLGERSPHARPQEGAAAQSDPARHSHPPTARPGRGAGGVGQRRHHHAHGPSAGPAHRRLGRLP